MAIFEHGLRELLLYTTLFIMIFFYGRWIVFGCVWWNTRGIRCSCFMWFDSWPLLVPLLRQTDKNTQIQTGSLSNNPLLVDWSLVVLIHAWKLRAVEYPQHGYHGVLCCSNTSVTALPTVARGLTYEGGLPWINEVSIFSVPLVVQLRWRMYVFHKWNFEAKCTHSLHIRTTVLLYET